MHSNFIPVVTSILFAGFLAMAAHADEVKTSAESKSKPTPATAVTSGFSTLLPTSQTLPVVTPTPTSSSAESAVSAKKANDRWLPSNTLKAEKPADATVAPGKVTWATTCTNANGKVLASTDEGYSLCMQQASAASQEAKNRPIPANKKSDAKPNAGAGFQMNFGK